LLGKTAAIDLKSVAFSRFAVELDTGMVRVTDPASDKEGPAMTVILDGIEYLPASAVAAQLATTETRILMLIKQKALSGQMIEGAWFVTTASLACYDRHAAEPAKAAECRVSCGGSGCGCH
jgi:hypothetical protein